MSQFSFLNYLGSPRFNAKEYFEKCICPTEDEDTIDDEIRYDTGKSSTDQVILNILFDIQIMYKNKCLHIGSHRLTFSKLKVIESLSQSTRDKIVLYINLVIIVAGALGFYVYFSINPFTEEEISRLQKLAMKNISHHSGNLVDAISSSQT